MCDRETWVKGQMGLGPIITPRSWESFGTCLAKKIGISEAKEIARIVFNDQVKILLKSYAWKKASAIIVQRIKRVAGQVGLSRNLLINYFQEVSLAKSQLEQYGAERKKDGTGGTVRERIGGYITFALIFLLLPFGTATFLAIEEGISSGSVVSGLVAFGIILMIGVVFESVAYAVFRWRSRRDLDG